MTIDTTKLRELAENATPGPWETCETDETAFEILTGEWSAKGDFEGTIVVHVDEYACFEERPSGITSKANAQYIAAANPATVLALLDNHAKIERDLSAACYELAAMYWLLDLNPETASATAISAIARLKKIEAAARNLVKVKGRHHSELAMNQLLEALK